MNSFCVLSILTSRTKSVIVIFEKRQSSLHLSDNQIVDIPKVKVNKPPVPKLAYLGDNF